MSSRRVYEVLATVMLWDDARARDEFAWLGLMAQFKYDGYGYFVAGIRFLESLAAWLQQFRPEDREAAYAFLRRVLVYISPAEMLRLVELLFATEVQPRLLEAVANRLRIASHLVWSTAEGSEAYERALRRTLFLGLSEGARLDIFRRANDGVLVNDQVLLTTGIDPTQYGKLANELPRENGNAGRFELAYLIDDFTGSGNSCLRFDKATDTWTGKIPKFVKSIDGQGRHGFDDTLQLCVHHYIASAEAKATLLERERAYRAAYGDDPKRRFELPTIHFSFGLLLPDDFPVQHSPLPAAQDFVRIARKYFDPRDPYFRDNKHLDVGGTRDIPLGFANNGLPLVLDHNTPNNSVTLLWAESLGVHDADGGELGTAMRPLFRRRQRHG